MKKRYKYNVLITASGLSPVGLNTLRLLKNRVKSIGLDFPLFSILLAKGLRGEVKDEISKCKIRWNLQVVRIYKEIFRYRDNFFEL